MCILHHTPYVQVIHNEIFCDYVYIFHILHSATAPQTTAQQKAYYSTAKRACSSPSCTAAHRNISSRGRRGWPQCRQPRSWRSGGCRTQTVYITHAHYENCTLHMHTCNEACPLHACKRDWTRSSPRSGSVRHLHDVYAHLVRDVLQYCDALGVWSLVLGHLQGERERGSWSRSWLARATLDHVASF